MAYLCILLTDPLFKFHQTIKQWWTFWLLMWQTNKFVATTYAAHVVKYEQIDNITDCFYVVNVSLSTPST